MKETVIIAGSLAQQPGRGGHTWVFLQYILGFKKLGWDVVFVDHLLPEMCVSAAAERCSFEKSVNLEYFMRTMDEFDLNDSHALLYDNGERVVGMSKPALIRKVAESSLLINVMGFLRDEEILASASRIAFLDIDPGFAQMWQELGLCRIFEGHDCYVTIGENIGQGHCTIPTCGLKWITSRQPVQLDYWKPVSDSASRSFTSIASWRGDFGPIEFHGKTYGLRVHEFRKIVTLPRLTDERFDIALDIHPADDGDKHLLAQNGWNVIEPRAVSGNPRRYQDFIEQSGAEFMIAKNMYVATRSGWFSDRSCCYLASGKPVLSQDTDLKALYPVNKGLLTFTSLDEALSGVQEISRNYVAHSRAARDIAVEYFDSNKVLQQLVDKVC
jgi:hypothetical protein